MKIAIIGYGRIGQAIKYYLENIPSTVKYEVAAFDTNLSTGIKPQHLIGHAVTIKKNWQDNDYSFPVTWGDVVIAATPYQENLAIATECVKQGKPYFDLTEDVETTEAIRALTIEPVKEGKQVWVSPQCGLAPGAVGMIGKFLADTVEKVDSVELRVGALPQMVSNRMRYHLTWSTEGLINEYCNRCNVLVDGIRSEAQPLEGLETIVIDGRTYEAFFTSGGVGSLIPVLQRRHPTISKVNYKTIRYPGHRELMQFLLHDLRMDRNKETFVKLFNKEVHRSDRDVVILYVQVKGTHNNLPVVKTYSKKIYGDEHFTAIQRTTALGICTMVHYWASFSYPTRNGFAACEDMAGLEVVNNPFWQPFLDDSLDLKTIF